MSTAMMAAQTAKAGPAVCTMEAVEIKPVGSRIVVLPDEPEGRSQGGIIIPDSAKKRSTRGTVMAVGPGKLHPLSGVPIPVEMKIGDRILYKQYEGSPIESGGVEYRVLDAEQDVLAVIRDR